MMFKLSTTLASGFVALACTTGALAAPELVSNGGFETGDFSGWTTTDAASGSMYGVDTAGPHAGSYSAFFGGSGPASDTISQTIATSPGGSYLVSFSFDKGAGTQEGSFSAALGGVQFFSAPAGAFAFAPVSVLVTATAADSVLSFSGFNASDFYTLDGVSVVAAVPEPATFAMFSAGLLAIGVWSRRKKS